MMRAANSKHLIALGFTFVLALMLVMTGIGLTRMADLHQRLEVIVHEHNVKSDLLAGMRNAARERSLVLLRLSMSTDPFEVDDAVIEFRQYASDFMVRRQALTDMGLDAVEQRMLEESRALTTTAVLVQEQVLELILRGEVAEGRTLLLEHAIPAQNRVLDQLNEMLELHRVAASQTVEETTASYRAAHLFIILLGAAALILGVAMALFVTRSASRFEADLFQEKERAEVTLHSIGDAVITTDTLGRVEYLNPVAQQLTGWRADEARGKPLSEVFHLVDEATKRRRDHPLDKGLLDGHTTGLQQYAVLIAKDGRQSTIEEAAAPIRDREGRVIGSVVVFRDVSRSRELARQLSWAASHDALTGLANRREFERRLADLVASARQEGRHHALLYMDLDQFKVVNDTCGHVAGDELLRQLTATLEKKLRETDTLARLGGDEFGVLLERCPLDQAARIADVLRNAVAEFRLIWQEKVFEIGVSIGVVAISPDVDSAAAVMSDADAACYVAKDKGRNRIHVSQFQDRELSQRHGEMQWVQRISQALEENRFRLYYQRIVPLHQEAPVGEHYEVLLRMVDEAGELIAPTAFIPAAERYNLMPAVDRWVVRRMLSHLAAGNAAGPDRICAVNLSGQSLGDAELLDFIVGQLRETGVAPASLCFEITETAAIANLAKAMRFIAVLKGMGCRFALDDFGTGMSSFGYLKQLGVDYLKIDGSFVRDMVENPVSRAMVESINHIGHVLGIRTIAEFVENDDLLLSLREIGVDHAQGYGVHVPAPLPGEERCALPLAGREQHS